jgi:transcriptional regulator with XRE-family HTH domain
MSRTDLAKSGGELLARSMKRRGWSAPAVARLTGGEVSGSSILAYASGQTLPSAASAAAVSAVLPIGEGLELLRAWGFDEMADHVNELAPSGELPHASGYALATDSRVPFRRVPLGWTVAGTVVARSESGVGTEYIVRTENGTLLRMTPYYTFDASEQFFDAIGDEPSASS